MGIAEQIAEMEREIEDLRKNQRTEEDEDNRKFVEELRRELDEKTDALDSLRQHAPHWRDVPGDTDDERIKNAISRYDDVRNVLRDYWTDEELGNFDLVVSQLDEALEDYGEARSTLAGHIEIAEIKIADLDGKLEEFIDGQVAKSGALDVVEAATELLRDLEWQRPNSRPLDDLRDALRDYHGTDGVRTPSLPGVGS